LLEPVYVVHQGNNIRDIYINIISESSGAESTYSKSLPFDGLAVTDEVGGVIDIDAGS
jgi:hypothetical protein